MSVALRKMGLNMAVGLALLGIAGCARYAERPPAPQPPARVVNDAGATGLLHPGEFRAVHLEMDALDAQVLFRKDAFDQSTFPVSLVADGERLDGRIEVLGSFSRRFLKKSVLIKLDKGKEWQGSRRISLDGMATDGSQMREHLAWDTIHALGMAAPQVRYVALHINGEFIGVFLHTEWIEPDLFERYGLGRDGQFFHPNDIYFCGDLRPVSAERARECWFKLAPRDDDFTPIVELGEIVDRTPIERAHEDLASHIDLESVIDWLAVNTLVSNGDTYNKNYFLYRSARDGRWIFVPWDYDLSFGRNFDSFLPFPGNVYNDHFVYYYPPNLGAFMPLKEKVLRNPELQRRFLDRLRHLMGLRRDETATAASFGLWHPDAIGERISSYEDTLRAYVPADRYSRFSEAGFVEEAEAIRYYTLARWFYLRAKLFGDFPWDADAEHWDPEQAPPPSALPANLYVSDAVWEAGDGRLGLIARGYGYMLALLEDIEAPDGTNPLRFSAEVDMDRAPAYLPPTASADQCARRTWYLTLKTPAQGVVADLTLEYLQENSRRNELGAAMDERNLTLWVYSEGRWEPLPALTNALSNTLRVTDFAIPSGRLLRFVACSPEDEPLDTGGQR